MNSSIIRYILGNVMRMEACFLLLPCIVSLVYGEGVGLYYLGTAIVCLVFGVVMAWKKPKNYVFYLKEGCIATSLSWIVMSLVGCMPFWISGEIPSFTDAMFETVSGFTTTGASILTNVEALSHTALFWRSFTHWIGLGSYSPYLQWVVAIFMILFGVNFNAYYYIIYRHFKKAFKMEEVRCYFAIILIATAIIFANILDRCVSIFDALTKSVFQVASLITSTGFSSTDFNLWPQICRTVLVLIMFIGACAGSTGGGIKVSRVIVLFKTMIKELHSYIHPKSIRKVNLDGKPVEHEIVRSINVYIVTFVIIFASSVFMVAFDGKDLVTNFTAVLTTINNMGPGLAEVGPTGNFSNFSVFSKFVFMFDMLAGRLELFPLLILFHPSAWKDLISKRAEARKF